MINKILLWIIIVVAFTFFVVSILSPAEQPSKYTGPVDKITIAAYLGEFSSLVLEIDNNGTGDGIYIHQDGVLASSQYALWVYTTAVQIQRRQSSSQLGGGWSLSFFFPRPRPGGLYNR